MSKKNLYLYLSLLLLIISFVVFSLILPIKKAPPAKIDASTTKPTQITTVAPTISPLLSPAEQNIDNSQIKNETPPQIQSNSNFEEVKNLLLGGYRLGDLILEYRPKNNTFIVFYKNSLPLAKTQTANFFKSKEINAEGLEIEYLGER